MILVVALLGCGGPEPQPPAPPEPTPVALPRFEIVEVVPTPPEQPPTTAASVRLSDGRWVTADPGRRELVVQRDCPGPGCQGEVLPIDGAPVRVSEVHRVGEADASWVVADIGILWPSEARVGRVLRRRGADWEVLVDGLGRVVCAEPGDLDGDGDEDLAICEFGHLDGGLSWLEQSPTGWTLHALHRRPGTIRAIPADVDGDGDLDLVSIVSQDDERVLLHVNLGEGRFEERVLFDADRTDWGLSGLAVGDLDGDGDLDAVVTNGDSMDLTEAADADPYSWHGVTWFANDGRGGFVSRKIGALWGAYAPVLADFDGDGDLDVFVGAYQVPTLFPDAPVRNAVWFEHRDDGFEAHDVPGAPPQLMAAAVGDPDGDGRPDVLAGTLYMNGPDFGRRLVWFVNRAD